MTRYQTLYQTPYQTPYQIPYWISYRIPLILSTSYSRHASLCHPPWPRESFPPLGRGRLAGPPPCRSATPLKRRQGALWPLKTTELAVQISIEKEVINSKLAERVFNPAQLTNYCWAILLSYFARLLLPLSALDDIEMISCSQLISSKRRKQVKNEATDRTSNRMNLSWVV